MEMDSTGWEFSHPTAYNLYDMAGNAWEWCFDEYNSEFYSISPAKQPSLRQRNCHQIPKTFVSYAVADGVGVLKTSVSQIGGITSHLAAPSDFGV